MVRKMVASIVDVVALAARPSIKKSSPKRFNTWHDL
jgi:hypothetical protein